MKYLIFAVVTTSLFAGPGEPNQLRRVDPVGVVRCWVLVQEAAKRWWGDAQPFGWRISHQSLRATTPAIFLERDSQANGDLEARAGKLSQADAIELVSYGSHPDLLEDPLLLSIHLNQRFGNYRDWERKRSYLPELEIADNLRDGILLLMAYDRRHRTHCALDAMQSLVAASADGPSTISLDRMLEMHREHPSKQAPARAVSMLLKSFSFWSWIAQCSLGEAADYVPSLKRLFSRIQDQGATPVDPVIMNKFFIRFIKNEVVRWRTDSGHSITHFETARKLLLLAEDYFRLHNYTAIADEYRDALALLTLHERQDFLRQMSNVFSNRGLGGFYVDGQYLTFEEFYEGFQVKLLSLL